MQRTNNTQFMAMVDFMERNGDLLRPHSGAAGRLVQEGRWRELTQILNSDGSGPQKTAESWKKVWSDYKTKIKKRAQLIGRDIRGTGGGGPVGRPLSQLEERVLCIVGVVMLAGIPPAEEVGEPESPPAFESAPASLPICAGSSTVQMDAAETSQNQESIQLVSPSRPSHPARARRRIITPRNSPRRPGFNRFDHAVGEFVNLEHRRIQRDQERDRSNMALVQHLGVMANAFSSLSISVSRITDILERHFGQYD